MRYLGSKIKLLSSIDEVIKENNIEGETFADLFAGTGCVGDFFKDRYQIISNDFLFYSYVMNRAKLKNDSIPKFDCFRKKYKYDIFEWLNTQTYIPDDSYFIYLNYTPIGNRMFFTEENGIKIDGIRQKIEELKAKNIIDEEEYYYLIASMMESITKVSNISGTYEAFFKFWDSRAEKVFDLQPLEINEAQLHANNLIFNEDTNKLVREIKGDIAYIDPPYTVTQYISAYHMVASIKEKIKSVGQQIIETFRNLFGIHSPSTVFAGFGKNLLEGLWNGIQNVKSWLIQKIRGLGSAITDALKSVLGIHSPSTVFENEIGKNLGLGVGIGFEKAMDKVKDDMANAIPSDFDLQANVNSTIGSSGISRGFSLTLHIENFYNNTAQDIRQLAEELSTVLASQVNRKAEAF